MEASKEDQQLGPSRSSPFAEGPGPAAVYFLFRAGAWIAEHLNLRLADRLAEAVGLLVFKLARSKRDVVRRNFSRVVDDNVDEVVKKAFVSYAQYWLETFRLGRYSREDLLEMVVADEKTIEALSGSIGKGRGVILATAHLGFYDLGVAWIGANGWPYTTVGEVLRPRALFEWFAAIRERNGMRVLPAKPGAVARARMVGLLEAGEGVAILADRDITRRGLWAELFGERTTIPAGPALLALSTGARLVTGAIIKEGRKFRVVAEDAPYKLTGDSRADLDHLAQVIASGVEKLVRLAPEQWHLFGTNWPSDEPHLPPRGRGSVRSQ